MQKKPLGKKTIDFPIYCLTSRKTNGGATSMPQGNLSYQYQVLTGSSPLTHQNMTQVTKPVDEHPFPIMEKNNAHYKLFGVVTNRLKMSGAKIIHWHRERCGKSEEVHKIQKEDLMGGQLPSKRFGANAAFWQIMILAFNIQALMQRYVLGKEWKCCHLKIMRDYSLFSTDEV